MAIDMGGLTVEVGGALQRENIGVRGQDAVRRWQHSWLLQQEPDAAAPVLTPKDWDTFFCAHRKRHECAPDAQGERLEAALVCAMLEEALSRDPAKRQAMEAAIKGAEGELKAHYQSHYAGVIDPEQTIAAIRQCTDQALEEARRRDAATPASGRPSPVASGTRLTPAGRVYWERVHNPSVLMN